MNRAWLKLTLGFMACFFLIGYGTCFAQTEQSQGEPQTATAQQNTATPAPQGKGEELPPPLQAEMTIAEHWSKNPYPRTMAAGSRVHIVAKGDTLWDLAGRYYNNPFLWPQIWDANKYVPNAHWIYPGDPIMIPPLNPISEEQIAKETSTEPGVTGEPGETGAPGEATGGTSARSYPIGLDFDLYCSGYIVDNISGWKDRIISSEQHLEQVGQAVFDVVYLNKGESEGVSPGDEFTVLHYVRSVDHPVTLKPMGEYVIQTGRVKVIATQEHTSTAQVTYSCQTSLVGDYITPFVPKEVPSLSEMPPIDRYSPDGPGTKGYVVYAKDDLGSMGTNYELNIDLGSKDGLNVGSRLIIYRYEQHTYDQQSLAHYDLPRRVLGEMVVFNVEDGTATGRILNSFDYVRVGDRVEVR